METVVKKSGKKTSKFWYIGRRDNPQLSKPYFKMYGQLTKKEVKAKENCLYGSMSLTPYKTEEEYNQQIAKLTNEGYLIQRAGRFINL